MSTKIHNGYRLAAGTNPFEFTRRVRTLIDPIRDELDADLLARLFTGAVDTCWLKGDVVPQMLSFTAFSRWEEEQTKLKDEDRQKDPNRFEMCLGEDSDTGRVLVRLYTDQAVMAGAFESMDDVEPYSYWNNADEPQGTTPDQWGERQAAWDRVMPDYTAPAESMLTFTLRGESNPGTMMLCALRGGAHDPVLTKIPGRTERAINIARTRYVRLLVNTYGVETLAAFRHSLTARIKEELGTIGALIERGLWDIDRELLVEGGGERTSDPEIITALDAACAGLFEAEKDALAR
ncbi:hypothetical protein [Pseudarthrobacter sp. BIM B-2242]|uniref:hypothetical protein n=1 Tax=Pseudarthrobacter sp. BIM B-2242 TaxID=2772401 RepID=UPI00168A655F|nr:hypothetical protein [Pseudarthrobacter sp. BIM B-2242]QOD05684.1 hypothetical protein IDT60_21820 [Pseudarthrobacter sp. BIM B-2242]